MRLIDADELYEKLEKVSKEPDYQHEGEDWGVGLEIAMIETDVAPTINPEDLRPKGEWIVCGDGENVPWMCSHCGKTTAHKYKVMYGKFCPNCGAKLKE